MKNILHLLLASALALAGAANAQDGTYNDAEAAEILERAAAKGKNIVFILTDDQDQQMESLTHMKKLQKHLLNEGTHYRRHYAPTALCCPARVSLWTGLHTHNHLISSVSGPWGGWDRVIQRGYNDDYLPIWLQQAGYNTYYTGKLYNGMNKEHVEKTLVKGWTQAVRFYSSSNW
jgi:N-acetylglucosamine-6-sulfatase